MLAAVVPAVLAVGWLCAVRARTTWWTSDHTAQQSILGTWLSLGHATTYLPPDTWLLKLVVYLPVELAPLAPTTRLGLEVVLLQTLTLALVGWATWRLTRRARGGRPRWWVVALPLLWLAALPGGVGSNRMLPNYRNIELGLLLAALALAARYLDAAPGAPARRGRTLLPAAAAALPLALLWFDDPYVAALGALPFLAGALAAATACRGRPRARLLTAAGVVAGSLLGLAGLHRLAEGVGVQVAAGGTGLDLDPGHLWHRLGLLAPSVAVQTGIAPPSDAWTGWQDLALVVVLAVFATCSLLLLGRSLVARDLPGALLGGWPWLTVAAFLVNPLTVSTSSSRYLILGLVALPVAAAVQLHRWAGPVTRQRAGVQILGGPLAAGLAVATLTNVLTSVQAASAAPPPVVGRQQALLRVVESTGVVKGYAPYWSANAVTYLTDRRTTVVPVTCVGGRLELRRWLVDTARSRRVAQRSIYIWDPEDSDQAHCDRQQLETALGGAQAELPVGDGRMVLVFGRDIGAGLGLTPGPAAGRGAAGQAADTSGTSGAAAERSTR